MTLLTDEQRTKMLRNGREQVAAQEEGRTIDFKPVVKLFIPDTAATWLLTELVPNNPDIAFGLCDLGLGFPEHSYVSLSELETLRGPLGLPVERDLHFRATKTLSEYAREAHIHGRIGDI